MEPSRCRTIEFERRFRWLWFLIFCFPFSAVLSIEGPGRKPTRYRVSSEAHGTHYFMGTSAIPLEKGTGYYKNTMVTMNAAAFALTSHLTISAGVDLFSLITSRTGTLWFTRMQVSGSLGEYFHIGAQAFYATLPMPIPQELEGLIEVEPGFGSALGMITIGDERYQLTLNGGWSHDGERSARGPLLGAAAMVRIAANVAVITEHWLFTDPRGNYPVHSAGIRILGDDLAIDVGVAYDRVLAAKVLPIGLPFASATLNF